MQRLDRFLSEAGVASRRELREIVHAGRVMVNGVVVRQPEQRINEVLDTICFDGRRIGAKKRTVLLLNKPMGYVTSTDDPRDRTVMELLAPQYRALFPVGRLDKETEGLLLFTDDGELAHRLISPKSSIEKTYYAEHEGTADAGDVAAFAEGLTLRDGTRCLPAVLEPLGEGKSLVRVREGKYHQVRRMLASRQMPVCFLRRIAEGGLTLDGLPLGKYREVTEEEISGICTVKFDEEREAKK